MDMKFGDILWELSFKARLLPCMNDLLVAALLPAMKLEFAEALSMRAR